MTLAVLKQLQATSKSDLIMFLKGRLRLKPALCVSTKSLRSNQISDFVGMVMYQVTALDRLHDKDRFVVFPADLIINAKNGCN